ncbi:hypothetical protein MUP77_09035, partial [Candidatus Bathyarchaeota archaeon]|nr:hypothetical protein [Candidatus Bathyarchaeota archaeon]
GQERCQAFYVHARDIHFFIVGEMYELFQPDGWNGFKIVNRPEDIPGLYEVSVPGHVCRSPFVVDILLLIISFMASGILGNLAYDILKKKTRELWRIIPTKYKQHLQRFTKNSPVQEGDALDKMVQTVGIYLRRRLRGLPQLSKPNGTLYRAAHFLTDKQHVKAKDLAEHLDCTLSDARWILKLLGAEYSISHKQWGIPPHLRGFYGMTHNQECYQRYRQAETNAPFFVHKGAHREVAWTLSANRPQSLTEDEEMDFEVLVLQACTPDIEQFLQGNISDIELNDRVKVKSQYLVQSFEERRKNRKKGRSRAPRNTKA